MCAPWRARKVAAAWSGMSVQGTLSLLSSWASKVPAVREGRPSQRVTCSMSFRFQPRRAMPKAPVGAAEWNAPRSVRSRTRVPSLMRSVPLRAVLRSATTCCRSNVTAVAKRVVMRSTFLV